MKLVFLCSIFLISCEPLTYTGFEGDVKTVLSSVFLTDVVNGKSVDHTYSLGDSVTSLIQYHNLNVFQVISGGPAKPYSDDGKFSVQVVIDGIAMREVNNIGWTYGLASSVDAAFSWFGTWSAKLGQQDIPILDQTMINSVAIGKTYYIFILFIYKKRQVKLVIPMERIA